MDHHPNRTRAAKHADGPDYVAAYFLARANGGSDAEFDAYFEAYFEAAEQVHADAGNGSGDGQAHND